MSLLSPENQNSATPGPKQCQYAPGCPDYSTPPMLAGEIFLTDKEKRFCANTMNCERYSPLANTATPQVPTSTPNVQPPLVDITDQRMARYFASRVSGVLRYWPEAGKWLKYDGQRWTTDAPGGAFPALNETIRTLYSLAAKASTMDREGILKGLLKLEKHRAQKDILAAASNLPDLIVSTSQLDRDPMLLNVPNGTIDLKTGTLQTHNPADFITRLIPVEFHQDAPCPLYEKFLGRIMADKRELIGYLQRFIGYCLTGSTVEQVLLFFYGLGANGKSVLLQIILALMGDYASTAGADLLMARDRRGATNDLAALRGSRLVSVCEFEESDRLAEATVKTLTGGDRITCRFLYGEFFEYTPEFKPWLIGNHKPKIRGQDNGVWRRIHLVPFEVTIPEEERDPHLADKLMQELPGILAWAVRGCLEWQKLGLKPPEKVQAAVKEYRREEDIFAQWLDECCAIDPEHQAKPKELLESFKEFSGWRNVTATKMGKMLREAGFEQHRAYSGRFWLGIGLLTEETRHGEKTCHGDKPPF